MIFNGSMAALVTPFSAEGGKIDKKGLRHLVEFHIKQGTSAIVPCGTTGESATLSLQEHEMVVELTIEAAAGRIPVIAGAGSNNTSEAAALTKHAKRAGADAALLISPYYNKPTQEGLYLHFKAVAEAVDIPIILYNIASRTGVNIEPETVARLATVKNIIGIKEASGNLEQMSKIVALCPKTFALISGDDGLTLPVLAIGGTGVISVVANIVPKDVSGLIKSFRQGDIKRAKALHYKLLPLVKAMFIETNPIPVKTAMGLMKMIEPSLRLPLCKMSDGSLQKLKTVLKEYGLI